MDEILVKLLMGFSRISTRDTGSFPDENLENDRERF